MHILANENIPVPSIRKVRAAAVTLSAITEDSPGVTDVEVLSRAARDELVIWTFDRDYGDLIFRQGLPTPKGVLYFRFSPNTPEEPATLLLRLLADKGMIIEGMFTVVDRIGYRQRALP